MTAALMLQGTSSDAGKSLLVAGLCRHFANRGLAVRPFKPQNMSNNAAATADGGEIGRAQALQALACRAPLSTDMNPVLLKPASEIGAQVVVQGRVRSNCNAREYHRLKPELMAAVLESFTRLGSGADLVVVEGAGSPAEVNLRAGDIANMGFATAAGVPVVLAGDIERGGVIAQLVGTMALLEEDERHLVKGYIVNKFRGDPSLFDNAHPIIAARTGLGSLGVVPWFEPAADLPAEDVLGLKGEARPGGIRIVVPRLPRISNFDDLDPLRLEPDVDLLVLEPGRAIPGDADLVLLPGSKATRGDLAALREAGWDIDILAHHRRGGWVLGLCGGYQMLGQLVHDPLGLEGLPGSSPGLGLLDIETTLAPQKTVRPAIAEETTTGQAVQGYEIHQGRTTGPDTARPMLRLGGQPDGAITRDGRVMGAYLHGLFQSDAFRHAFLSRLRRRDASDLAYAARIDAVLDELAAHLAAHLDMARIAAIAGLR
jgi:adenosylcobyric acid synthase